MAAVERLLQQLGAFLGPRRQQDAQHVQVVVPGGLGARHLQPDQQAAKLGRGEASSNDRAMQARIEIPDAGAALARFLKRFERIGVGAVGGLVRGDGQQLGDRARLPLGERDVVDAGKHAGGARHGADFAVHGVAGLWLGASLYP